MPTYQTASVYTGTEWVQLATSVPNAHQWVVSTVTATSYTPAITDAGKMLLVSNSSPVTLSAPSDATTAFVIGQTIAVVRSGTGTVTISAGAGATVNSKSGYTKVASQHGVVYMTKTASNTWLLSGDLGA